ncbi:LamG domain-containing protein [bacterium]|nr:LamG domain-containing protein [bacterium]MBU1957892.1 LamG domain-containing protein [bacterium]
MFLIKILLFVILLFSFAFSKGEVSKIYAHHEDASKTDYYANGKKHKWGEGNNLIIDGFEYNGHRYNYISDSPIVKIRRVDNTSASGEPCGLFAEKKNNDYKLSPSFPQTDGKCDMAKVMAGRTINVGALDLFRNVGYTAKNVERVDFISPNGINAPSKNSDLPKAGHVVTEKSGNNYLQIAAILSIDENNNPTSFGPLVMVHKSYDSDSNVRYGMSKIYLPDDSYIYEQSLGFYVDNTSGDQGEPWYIESTNEALGMAFVSLQDLGVSAGQKYYGFAYFGRDVTTQNDTLTDVTTFPRDTGGDTADPYGGVASYFADEEVVIPPSNVATCYALPDDNSKLYKVTMLPNGTPLPTPTTINLSTTFNGEGTAFRASNNTLYAFKEGSNTDLYAINLTTNSINKAKDNLLNDEVEGAEFYYDPIAKQEILYIIGSESNSKLYAYYADTWAALPGYPKSIYGATTSIDSLAINPLNGEAFGADDYNYNHQSPKLYHIDLKTGKSTFKVQTSDIVDAEGLAFASDGNLYIEDERYLNGRKIYQLNLETGALTPAAELGGSDDVEGLSCNGTQIAIDKPTIRIDDQTITEGDNGTQNLVFNITLSKAPTEAVTFDYAVFDGNNSDTELNAQAPGDYSSTATKTKISDEQYTISVPVNGDDLFENNETLIVKLSNIAGAIIEKDVAVGTIINDDEKNNGCQEKSFSIINWDFESGSYPNVPDGWTSQTRSAGPGFHYRGDQIADDEGILILGADAETWQDIDVSSRGGGEYLLSYYESRHDYANVEGSVRMKFLDGSKRIIGESSHSPITSKYNSNVKKLEGPKEITTTAPNGTQYIRIFFEGKGSFATGFAKIDKVKLDYKCDNPTPITPIAEYRFDECFWNGTTGEVNDSSGNDLHGTAKNGLNTTPDGKIERSGLFDGTDDYIDLGNNFNPENSDTWSVSVWFKSKTTNGTQIIYNKENLYEAAVMNGYFMYAFKPYWAWGNSFPVVPDTWYHAVITYDGVQQKVYKDGVEVYSRNQTGNIGSNTNKLLIGARGSNTPHSFFNGNIDEFKIYNNTLSASQIKKMYDNEKNATNWDETSRDPVSCMQPINCLPTALMFQNKPTDINVLDLMTGKMNELKADVLENNINGVGYNKKDGYFWGSDHTLKNGTVVQIGQDASGDTVAKSYQIENYTGSSYVGDIDAHGHLYLKSGKVVDVIDLDPNSNNYLKHIHTFNLTSNLSFTDWAFNPNDDFLYAINNGNSTKYLYKIDPSDGTILSQTDTKITGNRTFGANFFDADGFLYSYDNNTGQIFRTDVKNNAHTDPLSDKGSPVSLNDGAMCTDITFKFDFGDLPDSYGTTLAQDGARHSLPSSSHASIYMGSTVTHENEGRPSDDAHLDSADDGVDFNNSSLQGATLYAGQNATFNVTVAGNGYLNAWIDWNADGDFNDTNEQIATNISNTGNVINFTITAPNNKTRTTYARFRYSSEYDLNATGYAINGEVEDYQIDIKGNLQPFTCSEDSYMFAGDSKTTPVDAYQIDLKTGDYNKTADNFYATNINAIGYNVIDNMIWGYDRGTKKIAQVDSQFTVAEYAVSTLIDGDWFMGDVSLDGILYMYSRNNQYMYKVDVNKNSATYLTELPKLRLTNKNLDSGDFSFHPIDKMIYMPNEQDGNLYKINPSTGEVTNLDSMNLTDTSMSFNVTFFDKNGNFYIQNDKVGKVYQIDLSDTENPNPTASFFSNLPGMNYSDGARCPNADLEQPSRLRIKNNISKPEGDSGITEFTFTLLFDKPTNNAGFSFIIRDGTDARSPIVPAQQASPENDYLSQSGYIAVPLGAQELNITVQVVGDQKMEFNEEFYLDLYDPKNILLQDSRGVGTIINDDMVLFNIERTNSDTVDNATQKQKESLYTQITGRDFNYAVVVYDENQTINAQANVEGITLKVELFDYNSSVTDNLLYSSYLYFPESELKSRLKVIDKEDLKIAQATRDAGFKISYLVDQNDSIVYGQYNNETAYNTNKKSHREETVNARDNFAIRPASYRVSIDENGTQLLQNNKENSINLAAEHDYNLLAYATRYQSEDIALNYTITDSQELNVSMIFKNKEKLICDNEEDKNQNNAESMKYLFNDGVLTGSNTLTHDNVGTYTLHIQDINWTKVDQNSNSDLAGCIANSAIVSESGDEKSGCNVVSNLNDAMKDYSPKHYNMDVTFKPYAFDLNNMSLINLPKTAHNYVYMNDLHDNTGMGVHINGDVIAKGEKGSTLTNFSTGCVAEDVEISIDYNVTTTEGTFSKTVSDNTDSKSNKDDDDDDDKSYTNPFDFLKKFFSLDDFDIKTTRNSKVQSSLIIGHNGTENNATYQELHEPITLNKAYFLNENNGSCNLEILYNIEKDYKETINPVKIDFISLEANATTSNSTVNNQEWFPTGKQNLNQTRYFYFTRLAPDLENYNTIYDRTLATPVTIEIYCEHNRSWCTEMIGSNGLNSANTQVGWYTAQHHDVLTDGTINVFEIDEDNVTVTDISNSFYNDGRFNQIKTNYSGDKKTVVTKIDIYATSWLNYHPNAVNGIPFWKIKFKKMAPADPSGIGQTGHKLELNRNAVPANRLGW